MLLISMFPLGRTRLEPPTPVHVEGARSKKVGDRRVFWISIDRCLSKKTPTAPNDFFKLGDRAAVRGECTDQQVPRADTLLRNRRCWLVKNGSGPRHTRVGHGWLGPNPAPLGQRLILPDNTTPRAEWWVRVPKPCAPISLEAGFHCPFKPATRPSKCVRAEALDRATN